jgi:hypothetical protein
MMKINLIDFDLPNNNVMEVVYSLEILTKEVDS